MEHRTGDMPLGTFIKAKALDSCGLRRQGRSGVMISDTKTLAQILALLGQSRVASNLNQLARAANIGSLMVTPEVERELCAACAHIADIRALLVRAIGLKDGRRAWSSRPPNVGHGLVELLAHAPVSAAERSRVLGLLIKDLCE